MLSNNNKYHKSVTFKFCSFFCFYSGPDLVIPTDNIVTWLADQPVKLRLGDNGSLAKKPISIITAFRQTVEKFSSHPALGKLCVCCYILNG